MSDATEPLTDLEILKALTSDTCRCGGFKRPNMSFCGKCYHALPEAGRRDLYKRLGKGYREAYEAACALLDAGEGH